MTKTKKRFLMKNSKEGENIAFIRSSTRKRLIFSVVKMRVHSLKEHEYLPFYIHLLVNH